MTGYVKPAAEFSAALIEILGVGVILALALYSLGDAAFKLVKGPSAVDIFQQTRNRLIRGVLLGLEFLVAADIITTVAIELNFQTVSVLAIIVAIRTFLSFTLEVEMTGKWPWQQNPNQSKEIETDPE